MDERFNLLRESLDELEIKYEEHQIDQFADYYDLLIDWNSRMNLTAVTDLDDVILKHFVDSILICRFIDLNSDVSLIDVGSGAGFPGIPIKIMNPECRVVLLDSLNKRINFLETVVGELDLKNIKCIHGRAEDVSREKDLRGSFDYSVSRAVANLSTLSEYCVPFLRQGGRFISYKSDKADEEINAAKNAIKLLGSKIISVDEVQLPHSDILRKFVIIENEKPVSMKYPRKAGVPSRMPL